MQQFPNNKNPNTLNQQQESLFMGAVAEKMLFKSGTDKLAKATQSSIFDFSVKDIDGNNVNLASYKGKTKAFIFVNVACACGLTGSQYTGLVALYKKYQSQGLEIMGFPCNQFMGQESKAEKEIKEFVKDKFNVTFPMFSKIEVNGESTHPLYVYLRNNSELFDAATQTSKNIPWNFGKFLVNREGKVVKFYGPKVEPAELEADIQKLLN